MNLSFVTAVSTVLQNSSTSNPFLNNNNSAKQNRKAKNKATRSKQTKRKVEPKLTTQEQNPLIH